MNEVCLITPVYVNVVKHPGHSSDLGVLEKSMAALARISAVCHRGVRRKFVLSQSLPCITAL